MSTSIKFSTADEAKAAIVEDLGDYADDHDIDAIFDATHQWRAEVDDQGVQHGDGWFEQIVDTDEFWQIVEQHDISIAGAALTMDRNELRDWMDDTEAAEFADLCNRVLDQRYPRVRWADFHDELNLLVHGNGLPDVTALIDYEAVWTMSVDELRAEIEQGSRVRTRKDVRES